MCHLKCLFIFTGTADAGGWCGREDGAGLLPDPLPAFALLRSWVVQRKGHDTEKDCQMTTQLLLPARLICGSQVRDRKDGKQRKDKASLCLFSYLAMYLEDIYVFFIVLSPWPSSPQGLNYYLMLPPSNGTHFTSEVNLLMEDATCLRALVAGA